MTRHIIEVVNSSVQLLDTWSDLISWLDVVGLGSPFLSILVALLTVGTTFYFQEKRSRVRSLLALKAEAESNREMTADNLLILSLDVTDDSVGWLTPSSLSTDSFTVTRNNGTISKISKERRDLISNHYMRIKSISSEISKINNMWVEERLQPETEIEQIEDALLTTEERTLEFSLIVFDDDGHEKVSDVRSFIKNYNENIVGSFEYSYEGVIEELEREIDKIAFSFIFR